MCRNSFLLFTNFLVILLYALLVLMAGNGLTQTAPPSISLTPTTITSSDPVNLILRVHFPQGRSSATDSLTFNGSPFGSLLDAFQYGSPDPLTDAVSGSLDIPNLQLGPDANGIFEYTVTTPQGSANVSLTINIPTPPVTAQFQIKINEVLFDAPFADQGEEWVEITNIGRGPINLRGWSLMDHTMRNLFSFPDITVAEGEFVVVELGIGTSGTDPDDGSLVLYTNPDAASDELSNEAGGLLLVRSSGGEELTIEDAVFWSSTGAPPTGEGYEIAVRSRQWAAGDFIKTGFDSEGIALWAGEPIGRDAAYTDTNTRNDWFRHGGQDAFVGTQAYGHPIAYGGSPGRVNLGPLFTPDMLLQIGLFDLNNYIMFRQSGSVREASGRILNSSVTPTRVDAEYMVRLVVELPARSATLAGRVTGNWLASESQPGVWVSGFSGTLTELNGIRSPITLTFDFGRGDSGRFNPNTNMQMQNLHSELTADGTTTIHEFSRLIDTAGGPEGRFTIVGERLQYDGDETEGTFQSADENYTVVQAGDGVIRVAGNVLFDRGLGLPRGGREPERKRVNISIESTMELDSLGLGRTTLNTFDITVFLRGSPFRSFSLDPTIFNGFLDFDAAGQITPERRRNFTRDLVGITRFGRLTFNQLDVGNPLSPIQVGSTLQVESITDSSLTTTFNASLALIGLSPAEPVFEFTSEQQYTDGDRFKDEERISSFLSGLGWFVLSGLGAGVMAPSVVGAVAVGALCFTGGALGQAAVGDAYDNLREGRNPYESRHQNHHNSWNSVRELNIPT